MTEIIEVKIPREIYEFMEDVIEEEVYDGKSVHISERKMIKKARPIDAHVIVKGIKRRVTGAVQIRTPKKIEISWGIYYDRSRKPLNSEIVEQILDYIALGKGVVI